jgi:hypothetical protein
MTETPSERAIKYTSLFSGLKELIERFVIRQVAFLLRTKSVGLKICKSCEREPK